MIYACMHKFLSVVMVNAEQESLKKRNIISSISLSVEVGKWKSNSSKVFSCLENPTLYSELCSATYK